MAKTYSCLLVGVEVHTVEIETIVGSGFSGLNILGINSSMSRDMRERVRSALESVGFPVPARRVVVNITPNNTILLSRTPLAQLDFAVAASVIYALLEEQEENPCLHRPAQEFFAGELALSGAIKPLTDSLMYESLLTRLPPGTSICLADFLKKTHPQFEYFAHLTDWLHARRSATQTPSLMPMPIHNTPSQNPLDEFHDDIISQAEESISVLMKNPKLCVALLVAIAGQHHILLAGEPGVGKSYSIHKIRPLLLPLNERQRIEVKLIQPSFESYQKPFRSPHHSSTSAALIGGQSLKPGEVTLAHNGILFLDELAEFSRTSLEALREPLDSGQVALSRTHGNIIYPSQFQLCATTNPCPCGYLFSRKKPCRCNPKERKKYLQKISGPLLDRFPLQVWVNHPNKEEELDVFCETLIELKEKKLLREFILHFFNIQKNNTIQKDKVTDISLQNIEHISLRGADHLQKINATFNILFKKEKNTDLALNYRTLNDRFTTKDALTY